MTIVTLMPGHNAQGVPLPTTAGETPSAPSLPDAVLIGQWELDETSGTTAADSSATDNDGTYANVTLDQDSLADGDSGGSVRFITTSSVAIPHNVAYEVPSFSVRAHGQVDVAPAVGANAMLVQKDRAGLGGGWQLAIVNDGGTIRPQVYTKNLAGSAFWVGSSAGIPDVEIVLGEAFVLEMSCGPTNGTRVKFNKSVVGSNANAPGLSSNDEQIGVGRYRPGITNTAGLSGWIDKVYLYSGELTDEQSNALPDAQDLTPPDPEEPPVEYTPFPFVIISNPTVNHFGVSAQPGYSPTDPQSAAVEDPMSGLPIFRIAGNNGTNVLINGTTDSGLNFPGVLRNDNLTEAQKVWNADGTLLMIDRRFSSGGDPSSPASSYLIDVDGSHGASTPWRIIRASAATGLGDFPGTASGIYWCWDPLNPLRAYVPHDDGSISEWWPVGGDGHSEGELNQLYGAVANFGSFLDNNRICNTSWDGIYLCQQARRNSDGRRGGIRINLHTGERGPFTVSPDFGFSQSGIDHGNRSPNGISPLGNYTGFQPDGSRWVIKSLVTGAEVADTLDVDSVGISHTGYVVVNGVEALLGVRTDICRRFNLPAGTYTNHITTAEFQGANPNHITVGNNLDLFETYGGEGSGATTGLRYAIYSRSSPRNGHPRGIMGIRLGPNDQNEFRYLCNHRSVRDTNRDECHAQISRDGRKLVFPSDWAEPTGNASTIQPYIVLIPDAWRSPNNDGS